MRLSNGSQYFPIISRRDWVSAVTHLAESTEARGPFNLVCPTVPSHREFADTIAAPRTVRLAVPAGLVRLAAGTIAPEVLGSIRATPEALIGAGFRFSDTDVTEVVSAALGER